LAQRVRTLLALAGLDTSSVLVVPSLTEAGQPVVYLSTLTDAARRHLAQILPGALRPPPDDRGGGQHAANELDRGFPRSWVRT
ncbi:MAG: hypothetical protein ACRDR6_29900, partial [Pseudonocardiaceae bacterium]